LLQPAQADFASGRQHKFHGPIIHYRWNSPILERATPLLSSGLAHGAFKKIMRNAPTAGSDQFVEELILTVMV
jgi:hypothetical protein